MAMSTKNVHVTTRLQDDEDWSAYRFGQAFSYSAAREVMDRDPYGDFLTVGLPLQTLGQGFEIVDDDDEPVENMKKIWKVLEPEWNKIIERGGKFERTFGQSILLIVKSQNPETKDEPFVKVFEPFYIDDIKYYNDESLMGIQLCEREPNSGQDVEYRIGDIGASEEDPAGNNVTISKDINLVYNNIQRTKEHYWEGASYLEPVWDELMGLMAIRMGATLFAIRVGAGLKIIRIPPGTDPNIVADMKDSAKKLESFNGFFIVPLDEAEVNIETGRGMVDYDALKQALLGSLATKTGYPKAAFEGIEMERQGGSFNEERLLDCERMLQRGYRPIAEWLTTHFNDYHSWGVDFDQHKIRFNRRELVNERAKAEVDEIVARTDAQLVSAGIKSVDECRSEWGLEGPAPDPPNMFGINVKGLGGENPPTDKEQPQIDEQGDKE